MIRYKFEQAAILVVFRARGAKRQYFSIIEKKTVILTKKMKKKSSKFRGIPWIPRFRPVRRLGPKTRNPWNSAELSLFLLKFDQNPIFTFLNFLKKSTPKSKIFRGIPWIPCFRPVRRLGPKTRNTQNSAESWVFGQNLLKIHCSSF